jgi:hypothetical protein
LFSLFLGQEYLLEYQGGRGREGGRRREGERNGHRRNSPVGIVIEFYEIGNEAIGLINEAIIRNSNNTALVAQLQSVSSAFTTCEQTALQNLATALNVTAPTTLSG